MKPKSVLTPVSVESIISSLYGPKDKYARQSKESVTHAMSLWEVSQLHHLLANAHKTADESYNHAREALAAAHRAKMESWKALAEVEVLLESLEIKAGVAGQTRFLTIEAEEEDEEHA